MHYICTSAKVHMSNNNDVRAYQFLLFNIIRILKYYAVYEVHVHIWKIRLQNA